LDSVSVADPIDTLIVSDLRFFVEPLTTALNQSRQIRVVAGAASVEEAIRMAARLRPSVVLIDATMDGAPSVARRLRDLNADTKLLSIGVQDEGIVVAAWAQAGCHGYVTRGYSVEDLVRAVLGTIRGELVCSPRVAAFLMSTIGALAVHRSRTLAGLTAREFEVLDLVASGLSNKAIARQLDIKLSTVKNHLHNAFEKLQVSDRVDAVSRLGATRGNWIESARSMGGAVTGQVDGHSMLGARPSAVHNLEGAGAG
jgi:two-component system, NarL family, nitrate/nitrite response regulator NarL